MRRAVTIFEVLLAFVLVGMTMLPLVGLFSAASDHANATSDHTLTLALSSKIAEELRAASWEDRHFSDGLDRDPRFGGLKTIVDDGSPFFTAVEDSAMPAGRIRPREDAGIVPELGRLHRELLHHQLLVEGRHSTSATGGELIDISILFDWSDTHGRSRRTNFAVALPRSNTVALPPSSDREAADRLIVVAFYGSGVQGTLTQVAAARGADLEVLRALGDVAIISPALEDAEAAHQEDLANIEEEAREAPSETARARALSQLARVLENRACLRLRVAEFLASALQTLAARFTLTALGRPPPPRATYLEPVRLIAYLPLDFDWDLTDSITVYRRAIGLPHAAIPARVRNGMMERAIALAQLMALTTGPEDPTLARSIVTELIAFNDGRNRNLVAFGNAELVRCRDAATLRAGYHPASRLAAWSTFTGNLIPGVSAVLSDGQSRTAPAGFVPGGANAPGAPPSQPGSRVRPGATASGGVNPAGGGGNAPVPR